MPPPKCLEAMGKPPPYPFVPSRTRGDNPIASLPPSCADTVVEAFVGVLEPIERAIVGKAVEAGIKSSIHARKPVTFGSLHWPTSASVPVSRRREDYEGRVEVVVTRNAKAFSLGSSAVDLTAFFLPSARAREGAVVEAGHWVWIGRLAPENRIAQGVRAVVFTLHVPATGNLHCETIFQILRFEDVRLHKLHGDVEELLECADWRARSVGVDQLSLLLARWMSVQNARFDTGRDATDDEVEL